MCWYLWRSAVMESLGSIISSRRSGYSFRQSQTSHASTGPGMVRLLTVSKYIKLNLFIWNRRNVMKLHYKLQDWKVISFTWKKYWNYLLNLTRNTKTFLDFCFIPKESILRLKFRPTNHLVCLRSATPSPHTRNCKISLYLSNINYFW